MRVVLENIRLNGENEKGKTFQAQQMYAQIKVQQKLNLTTLGLYM